LPYILIDSPISFQLDDINKLIKQYRAEGKSVSKGISILQEVVSKMSERKKFPKANENLHNIFSPQNKDEEMKAPSQTFQKQQFIYNKNVGLKTRYDGRMTAGSYNINSVRRKKAAIPKAGVHVSSRGAPNIRILNESDEKKLLDNTHTR